MRLTTTNLTMLVIGILLILSAWYRKPILTVAKELVKDGKISPEAGGTPEDGTTNPLDAAQQAGRDVSRSASGGPLGAAQKAGKDARRILDGNSDVSPATRPPATSWRMM